MPSFVHYAAKKPLICSELERAYKVGETFCVCHQVWEKSLCANAVSRHGVQWLGQTNRKVPAYDYDVL